jgi:hypothetical protein
MMGLVVLFGGVVEGQISSYTEASMREMLRARECIPHEVVVNIDQWFKYIPDMTHYRYMNAVAFEQLTLSLQSGKKLCPSLSDAHRRVLNLHRHNMRQREASSIPILEGDGWRETLKKMESVADGVLVECQMTLATLPKNVAIKIAQHSPVPCLLPIVKKARHTAISNHIDDATFMY